MIIILVEQLFLPVPQCSHAAYIARMLTEAQLIYLRDSSRHCFYPRNHPSDAHFRIPPTNQSQLLNRGEGPLRRTPSAAPKLPAAQSPLYFRKSNYIIGIAQYEAPLYKCKINCVKTHISITLSAFNFADIS
ncbi:hypothetical protein AOQ84DRAFT_206279 [Glonium stellatum]|uniref:Uncharacterized protein n=1 Tax=Glonium stellatum TaxID=574774 RepID=A0A8E2F5E6_9PEZI|nr:hypothetical protein AOQ84DRAFT_206279 [Glonium stellatum]